MSYTLHFSQDTPLRLTLGHPRARSPLVLEIPVSAACTIEDADALVYPRSHIEAGGPLHPGALYVLLNWMRENAAIFPKPALPPPDRRSLPQQIEALVRERDELRHLVGTMLATMTLPGNAESFAALPAAWHESVASWQKQFKAIPEGKTP